MSRRRVIQRIVKGQTSSSHAIVDKGALLELGIAAGETVKVYGPLKATPVQLEVGEVGEDAIHLPRDLFASHEGEVVFLIAEEAREISGRSGRDAKDTGSGKPYDGLPVQPVKTGVSFDDIAGMEDTKEKIRLAIVYPFTYPEAFSYYKRRAGGGVLLYGPPGCGKSLIAAAAATECGGTFLSLKGSDIKNMYVGESEKNVSRVFNLARQENGTIVFIDEIDTILPSRVSASADHERSLVGEFLAQMDGLEGKGLERNYLVLVATNRPWALDLPFRDRFDTLSFIPHPDGPSRRQQLEYHLEGRPVDRSVDLDVLAKKITGLAGRNIQTLCDKAADIPLREFIKTLQKEGTTSRTTSRTPPPITMENFETALQDVGTVLRSWYREALDQLAIMPEENRQDFQELIDTAKNFLAENKPSHPVP